jgi:pentatricopeptide repeat protein
VSYLPLEVIEKPTDFIEGTRHTSPTHLANLAGIAIQLLNALCLPYAQGIEPVTRTYNTLMIACNTSGQWQTALQLYEEMRAAGHALNTTSYNALISAHSKAGDLPQVLDTYRQMVQQV